MKDKKLARNPDGSITINLKFYGADADRFESLVLLTKEQTIEALFTDAFTVFSGVAMKINEGKRVSLIAKDPKGKMPTEIISILEPGVREGHGKKEKT